GVSSKRGRSRQSGTWPAVGRGLEQPSFSSASQRCRESPGPRPQQATLQALPRAGAPPSLGLVALDKIGGVLVLHLVPTREGVLTLGATGLLQPVLHPKLPVDEGDRLLRALIAGA